MGKDERLAKQVKEARDVIEAPACVVIFICGCVVCHSIVMHAFKYMGLYNPSNMQLYGAPIVLGSILATLGVCVITIILLFSYLNKLSHVARNADRRLASQRHELVDQVQVLSPEWLNDYLGVPSDRSMVRGWRITPHDAGGSAELWLRAIGCAHYELYVLITTHRPTSYSATGLIVTKRSQVVDLREAIRSPFEPPTKLPSGFVSSRIRPLDMNEVTIECKE